MLTPRIQRLRQRSFEATPTLSTERAERITRFYQAEAGKHSAPVLRALAFYDLCAHKALFIGEDELIVGERGPVPKAVSTYPELTCHSLEDLRTLDARPKTPYTVDAEALRTYEELVIPYWRGRSMRERILARMEPAWLALYQAGLFTEFMEQRAPGHTVLDGKVYAKGLLDFKRGIAASAQTLDLLRDPLATDKREELRAMEIACDAAILLAERYAQRALELVADEPDLVRRAELGRIAQVCRWVPAHAPRDLWEAIQMYWFCHLGVITELNGWDSFNPGHLDQHLQSFYERGLAEGALTREAAKELIACLWIKFNNQPAPPKVGVTAEESGTYNDFVNINLGGLAPDGTDGVNELSYLMLEVVEELHLLQPGSNVQVSRRTPERFLKAACRVIRRGYGYPSLFNTDLVVQEQVRAGKALADARQGGSSGCVETGCFGKEAYILTGYLNLPKILELALYDGVDPLTGEQLGPQTGNLRTFVTFEALMAAFEAQLAYVIEVKLRGNQTIERMFASDAPAPFLSVLIDDCIAKGMDYNAGGPRYNTNYIQGVGIGTVTDSLAAVQQHVFDERDCSPAELLSALESDYQGAEPLRARLTNRTPRYGNDDDRADALMQRVFDAFYTLVEGRPNTKGGTYHIDMLPTTCHIYFGTMTGATPDGRRARQPLSEGISPVQGADHRGPTAVIRSAAKMDQLRTGGTLLNQKVMPRLLETEEGIAQLAHLVRTYFDMGGHHIQFNVVDAETLRAAQQRPQDYRGLIVRVAGYSDYFCDLGADLQEEIIARTAHSSF